MRGPAHNAILPFPIRYKEVLYPSFRQLMLSLNPPATVKEVTIAGRLHRRLKNGEVFSDKLLKECFYTAASDYQGRYGKRVTWLETADGRQSAEAIYAALARDVPVSYPLFRQRLKSLEKRAAPITQAQIEHASILNNADWITSYGGGRRKGFTYEGDLYPEYKGEYSAFTAFLKAIGRYGERDLFHSRLKARWEIDDLLSEPPMEDGTPGYIYKITDRMTGKCYVGLTVNKPETRFAQHKVLAHKGGGSLLHEAIRDSGAENFFIDVLEVVEGGEGKLAEREIDWITLLETQHPNGLNKSTGGQIGTYDGRPVVWDGRQFRSIIAMCRILSKETGLAEHVIRSRFSGGKPLPDKARKHSKHDDAGTPLFRQHLGLLKRARDRGDFVDPAWQDYERFKADVTSTPGRGRLTRIDESQPWGPGNWTWMTHKDIVARTHGKAVEAFGRSWPTLEEALKEYGIGSGTYNFRIKAGMSVEDALSKPLAATSKKEFTFEGQTWSSRNQACKELAARYGITPDKVKDRLVRKVPLSRWAAMDGKR